MQNNHFTKKEIQTKESFGKFFCQAREKTGQDLAQIASKLKIRENYLKAIEEEDFSLLPPFVYTKGFVLQYAHFLKLDAKEILKLYKQDWQNFEDKFLGQKKEKLKINLPFFDLKKFKIIAIAMIVLVFLGYLLYQFFSFTSNPFLILEEPEKDLKTSEPNVIFKGQIEKDAQIFINDREILTDENQRFKENIILQKGLNKVITKVINKLNKEQEIARNIFYEPKEKIAQEVAGKTEIKKEAELILEIKDAPAWISLTIDSEKIFEKIIDPSTWQFKVKENFLIKSGKPNNTYLKINNQDLGNLGEGGGTVEKEFDIDSFVQ